LLQYKAYGLTIQSELPLPELQSSAGAIPDVTVRLGEAIKRPPEGITTDPYTEITPDEAYLYWKDVGGFRICAGREVIIDPHPGLADDLIRLPLLGVVLAVLIHQRKHLVLHASGVEIKGRAVAFVGAKGVGKSTMAAALYAQGNNLLADDIVALNICGHSGDITMLPGFPHLKLWPDAVRSSLGDDPDSLPELTSGSCKRSRIVTDHFIDRAASVKCIYVLALGEDISIRPIKHQEALLSIIRESYLSRFARQIFQGEQASRHFKQCTTLVNTIDVCQLSRPRSLDLLHEAAKLVESHVMSLP
jgi:hypothetical protein